MLNPLDGPNPQLLQFQAILWSGLFVEWGARSAIEKRVHLPTILAVCVAWLASQTRRPPPAPIRGTAEALLGLPSSLRLEWRLIRSVIDLARVGEPVVGIVGRFVVLLCDLPTASDFRAPIGLLFKLNFVAVSMSIRIFPRHNTASNHVRTAKHAS